MASIGVGHEDMPSKKRKEHSIEDDTDSFQKLRGEKSGLIVSDQNDLLVTSVYQHDSEDSADHDRHDQSILKRQSDEFDLKDPFWQYLFITGALKRSTQFLENHEVDTMEVDVAETAPFDQAMSECAAMFKIERSATTSEEDGGLTGMTEVDTTTIVPSAMTAHQFERPQDLLDNISYQQDNHEEACQKIGIQDPTNSQILGMQQTERLKFWQPVAIWRIAEIRSNPNIRGAILADGFGLGKTWMVTGYLLHLLNEYENKVRMAQQNKQSPPKGKPVLIVVPPNLLIPLAMEILRIARLNRFKIFIYKCVIHKESVPKHTTHLTRPMERSNFLSRTSPYGANAIILTTYQSFGQRHGAGAIKKWQRENHLPVVDKPKEMPSGCPYNLSGCFSTVILDEGHMARNKQSGVHRTLTWLDADFYLLATATPFYNTITDFRGYMPFLFSLKPIWDDLEEELDPDVLTTNPFEVPDDHPAAIGRFTSEAVGRYILRRGISAETAGANMRKILQELMIRRTYSSRIPFESGPTIGGEIPLAHRKKIEVEWENVETTCYRKLSAQYRKSLLCKSEKSSKYMWSMKAYRSLVLLSAWLGMPFVEQSLDSAGFPLALKAFERGCVVSNWIRKALSNECMVTKDKVYEFYRGIPYSQSPASIGATTKLESLLRGSPKLRAMLPIVTEQVIVHQEKAIVWCAFPATQVFVCAALREAQIDARIHVGTSLSIELLKENHWHVSDVREEMQAEHGSDLIEIFNTKPDECIVLVCLYGVGASGLNLQSMCRNVHLFDAARSQSAVDHAIGRTCRLGQSRSVLVHEYRLKKSFHDEMILRNRKKAQPGMVTDLSTTIFKDLLESDDDESDKRFAAFDHRLLARWVVREGQLVELDEDEEPQKEICRTRKRFWIFWRR